MPALGVYACMPIKHLDQGSGPSRYPVDSVAHTALDCRWDTQHCPRTGPVHSLHEVAEHFSRGEYLFWQLHTKSTFETQQEFHPTQAVEAQIALQRTVERDSQSVVLMGMQLDDELPYNCEQRLDARLGQTLVRL